MAQLLHPVADISTVQHTTWSTPAWSAVDEVSPDDTDYTDKPAEAGVLAGAVNTVAVQIGPAATPASPTGANSFIHFRIKRLSSSSNSNYQGYVFLGDTSSKFTLSVLVSATLNTDVPNDGAFHQFDIALTNIESHSFDWSNLVVVFQENYQGAGAGATSAHLQISWIELELPSVAMNTYQLALPTGTVYQVASSTPSNYTLPVSEYINGVFYPAGTIYTWSVTSALATTGGWWESVDEQFAGASLVLTNSRPKDPRSFHEIASFATTNTSWMGGFPGPCCTLNNRMIYAAGGYTAGTDLPSIRIFDGRFDREVTRLPNTAAGAVPKAIMTMLAANDTIYLSTLDGGADSTDWAGRVFSLDIESGTLTPIGATFTAGHVPYALAWHMGRLWCGTHRQASTASGKIYYFRPDIDTSWTDDYTLSSSSMANCASLLSYKGLLYVGTTAAAATFCTVLVRSELGAYTTSKTASGGTAVANNGILALAEFSGNLYASFFNNDTPAVSKIYKFDNSSWSTAYTGSSTTIIPYVGFPIDDSILLAIGGGIGYSAGLLSTANGTSWTDETVFLSQGSPASTGLPCFGVVVR